MEILTLTDNKETAIEKACNHSILKIKMHELTDQPDKICQYVWPYHG